MTIQEAEGRPSIQYSWSTSQNLTLQPKRRHTCGPYKRAALYLQVRRRYNRDRFIQASHVARGLLKDSSNRNGQRRSRGERGRSRARLKSNQLFCPSVRPPSDEYGTESATFLERVRERQRSSPDNITIDLPNRLEFSYLRCHFPGCHLLHLFLPLPSSVLGCLLLSSLSGFLSPRSTLAASN